MTIRRFFLIFAAGLTLQGTAFAIYYDDLIYLRQPVTAITSGSPEAFGRHARGALGRKGLTVTHLDTIAEAAQSMGMPDLELRALERRVVDLPGDSGTRLRLADALRRAGRYDHAERLYLAILRSTPVKAP